ncbi:transcriptional regulator, LacI family [Lachnospiraceae bacterium XBB2008]|nr:transcriptional regulator, LacI family [Lachnospiraceae bacterium XBB2008]
MGNRIGILLSDILGAGLTHDLFLRIVDSFKNYAESEKYVLTFLNAAPRYMIDHTFVDQVKEGDLSGVFIPNATFDLPEVQALFKTEIPIVTIDYKNDNAVCISSDNDNGIKDLVNYVCVEKNHKNVAYISGDPESEVAKLRLRTFKSTCEEIGVTVNPEYIRESRFRDIRDVTRKTEELLNLPVPPTCIFFPDDYSAIGGINVIHNRGLEVPKDISYCGYDGVNLVGLWDPQLATVVQDTDTMGITAARELIRLITEGRTGDGSEIVVPTKLQVGHTVGQINTQG